MNSCQNKGFFNSEKVDLVGVVGLTRKYMWREER